MKASLCTFTLLCLPLAGAQYGGGGSSDTTMTTASSSDTTTTTASSTESGSASSSTQSVDVGKNGFTFDPDTIHVPAGGVVEFHFYPGDHSVAQAAFNNPCHPMSDTSFFSGFMASARDGKPVWSLTVNDTHPIWFYCGQVGHCQAGMVGVINPSPSGSDTLDAFKSAASNANGQSVPATAQGGILGTPSASQTTTTSSSKTTASGGSATTSSMTTSSMTTSSMTTSSSTSTTSGTPTTSTGAPSPSSTNMAENLRVSTELSALSILALTVAMLLM